MTQATKKRLIELALIKHMGAIRARAYLTSGGLSINETLCKLALTAIVKQGAREYIIFFDDSRVAFLGFDDINDIQAFL